MKMPMRLDDPTPAPVRATLMHGLPAAIDAVAAAAPATHAFLRRQWFAAAVAAYGGAPRTVVATLDGAPVLALPLVGAARRGLGVYAVPGCYWPFRSFPVAQGLCGEAVDAALAVLARSVRALRIGPAIDGDPGVEALVARARTRGWGVVSRRVADSFVLDMAAKRGEGAWPRNSTLKKNRFHEKHLSAHGVLDWRFAAKDAWAETFDAMAAIEARSWVAEETDGRDAKFTRAGHGAFFRAAAQDAVIADMFHAALLYVDGRPAAFSFDMDAGRLKYAIANSYDPAFAKHSPGKLLYYRNLVEALERGVTDVDWGAGDSGYKRVIGAEQGPAIRDWLLLRPGVPARLAPLVRRVWKDAPMAAQVGAGEDVA
jgi:CelD/BcsL family acetyltransferase involved in cellulose biosynthesis